MKNIIIPLITLFLTSCTVTNYYQVYKAYPEKGTITNDRIVFEDKNCIVCYNLWSNGGDVGFSIFNKTQEDLQVHLDNSFFVLNGVAYKYFQNRTFTKSSSLGVASTTTRYPYFWNQPRAQTVGANSTSSTAYGEQPTMTIPPSTLINISEYAVTNSRFTDCDLPKYPKAGSPNVLKYDVTNSPFVFSNLITYSTARDTIRLENKFFISEIGNFPSTEMFTEVDTTMCGKKLDAPKDVFKKTSPNEFYILYTKQ
ncbi:MAG: hypothetical protein IPP69_13170 [Flavobacteriales bacterium]|nr:hypothetical protein [Flavobacteriales bacterium]